MNTHGHMHTTHTYTHTHTSHTTHTHIPLTVHQPSVEARVVHKGLQYSHQAVLVLSQHSHHHVAGHTEVALNASHLHSIDQHSHQTKWDLLREFLMSHGT